MTVYDVGEPVALTGLFYSDAALTVLSDPTSVVLTIHDPAGVILTPAVVHAAIGTYTYMWTPLVRGMHEIHWVGTGAIAATEQYGINVRGGFPATTDLVDVQTLRARLRMPKAEDDQDPVLEDVIAGVSAHIVDAYQQEFVPATSVATLRSFSYGGNGRVDLAPFNAQSGTITVVTVDGDTTSPRTLLEGTDFFQQPRLSKWGVVNSLRIPHYSYINYFPADLYKLNYRRVDITAKWGYPTIPPPVREAAILTAISWYRRDGSRPSGLANEDIDDGGSGDVAIPQRARWLMRGFEKRSVLVA